MKERTDAVALLDLIEDLQEQNEWKSYVIEQLEQRLGAVLMQKDALMHLAQKAQGKNEQACAIFEQINQAWAAVYLRGLSDPWKGPVSTLEEFRANKTAKQSTKTACREQTRGTRS